MTSRPYVASTMLRYICLFFISETNHLFADMSLDRCFLSIHKRVRFRYDCRSDAFQPIAIEGECSTGLICNKRRGVIHCRNECKLTVEMNVNLMNSKQYTTRIVLIFGVTGPMVNCGRGSAKNVLFCCYPSSLLTSSQH